jgi:RNA recognition motif-containing protein
MLLSDQNLSFSVDNNSLETLFSQAGTVSSAKVITDRDSGRSKGFAFVEMSSSDEATQCISKFDGQEFEGRQMSVSEAKPQPPRDGRRF